MRQLALTGGQPTTDFARRVGATRLTKQHAHELTSEGEAARMALGLPDDVAFRHPARGKTSSNRLKIGQNLSLEELASV
jgi:hypothetical protein